MTVEVRVRVPDMHGERVVCITDDDVRRCPPMMRRIIACAGVDRALSAARQLGGVKVYVSENPRTSRISSIIGCDAVRALAADLGGGSHEFDMPSCRPLFRRLAIRALYAERLSTGTIAEQAQLTRRRVRQIVSAC